MFKNDAYMTRGFQNDIPETAKFMISNEIRELTKLDDSEVDYLQVFELNPNFDNSMQVIRHFQEQPPRENVFGVEMLLDEKPVNAKVYVIDDGTHHTYLLAEEY